MPKQRQPVELLTGILRHLTRDQRKGNRTLGLVAREAYAEVKVLRDDNPAYTPKRKKYKPRPLPF